MTIGESIRAHRQAAGLTQEDLADVISMTQTAVSYWETGKRQPGADDLVCIARALGCTVAELAGDAGGDGFTGWAVLELMGHRILGGQVSEHQWAGRAWVRIDLPQGGGQPAASQLYSPDAVYALTPCTEELARARGGRRPAPVRAALPAAGPGSDEPGFYGVDGDFDDD